VFGDSYQVVVGVPEPARDHVEVAAELALAMQREALPLRLAGGRLLRVRIGLHCGPVCAGLIGDDRLCFEVWGEAVDLARMLRNQAPPGGILTSRTMAAILTGKYVFERAPALRLDDTRELETRLLLGTVPIGE
jgi:class 3 adenylate cyclase